MQKLLYLLLFMVVAAPSSYGQFRILFVDDSATLLAIPNTWLQRSIHWATKRCISMPTRSMKAPV